MRFANVVTRLTLGGFAVLLLAGASFEAHANVYATDIKLNGGFTNITNSSASPVTITYILNEAATLGTTINILSNATVIDTITIASGNPGALRGSNSVVWGGTNSLGALVGGGIYTVSITAAATGFTNWTQTSIDTNAGNAAFYPRGLDVDKNTNSPYYGRVVMSCAEAGLATNPAAMVGLYKMNADGSMADEGWYGNAGYLSDDAGDAPTAGQMPNSVGYNPMVIRIGTDDRIYWADNSAIGAIIACDMQATTNQVVINSGTNVNSSEGESVVGGPNNYQTCPQISYLDNGNSLGIQQFDVAGSGTNLAVYLCEGGGPPSWGVWMFHLVNGQSDTNDTAGTQAVSTQGTNFTVTSAGISVDNNLDVFVGQYTTGSTDTHNRVFLYTNWNGGVLPPEKGGTNYTLGLTNTTPAWKVGSGDPYATAIYDTVINSRLHPTLVAVAMAQGAAVSGGHFGDNGGIRILSATNGSTIVTNLDITNWYYGVAFDNVGNVYGASGNAGVWREWSPPGANTNTTVAVATVQVTSGLYITSISVSAGTVTINFTGDVTDTPSNLGVISYTQPIPLSSYAVDNSATIIQLSPGVFQATLPVSGSTQFYRVGRGI